MFRSSVSYAIIGTVAKDRDLSVQALHQQLCTQWISVSLPNFYKIIAHMVDDQILIRPNGRIQLHALFTRFIANLTAASEKAIQTEEINTVQSLGIGQQHVRQESNLYDLNVIRTDLLGQLVQMHPWTRSYHYTSHPYYLLSTPEKEQIAMEDIASSQDDKSLYLIGNNSFLDRYAAQQLSSDRFECHCAAWDSPFPEEGYYADIIGDYIIECMFPKPIADHFSMFFTTILGLEGYKKELFCQVLKMKASCSIKLIHSPEHSAKMKAKIEKAFAPVPQRRMIHEKA